MPQTLLPNILNFISHIDPFDQLPEKILERVARAIQITYLAKGEQVEFGTDENEKYLYVIRSGSMEQRKADGMLRAKLGAEDLFGFTFLDEMADHTEAYTAIALEGTLLYLVPHKCILEILDHHPEYTPYFASQAQERLKTAYNVVWSEDDKGLFVKKVSDVASGKIAIVNCTDSIQSVAYEMRVVQRSAAAVVMKHGKVIGIITDRDMTKRVIAMGRDIQEPIMNVMTPDPMVVSPDDLVLHAASLMMQHNVRSLPVVENNKPLGLLTTSHLVQRHRMQAIFLIDKIKYAESIEDLQSFTLERQAIFEALVEGSVLPETIGRVMSMIMDAYTRRMIQFGIEQVGEPPCEFAWIVAGSQARNEVHIHSDQDNAIVYADSGTDQDRIYFLRLATVVCKGLDGCGYPLCSGDFMAMNRRWCQPLRVWKAYYSKWVASPEYQMLLNVTVFLEVRNLYGEVSFCESMQQHLHQCIANSNEFLVSLVNESVSVHPPLGIFNNLVLEKSGHNSKTLNIKKYALTLLVDLARIYALAAGSEATLTEERFEAAANKKIMSQEMFQDVIGAYRFMCQIRYDHQLEALKHGLDADNHIEPARFGSFERKHLKDAFRIVASLQDVAKLRFSRE
ncbi:CBS domain-containing protein [Alginatibacterium sediminis]|uniref:CBS domain-containing protein n=1 Tax=Alginatibacterium sediminis TaxID=2164068 RepID=A0A420E711_9ALTE|nr:putative nucleotidyltransferase substrate binding domain-containing protein [Alginatibacterium sediminis]RKF14244.1 CBS domain-containing protein [Alginatibacterium sediminis]